MSAESPPQPSLACPWHADEGMLMKTKAATPQSLEGEKGQKEKKVCGKEGAE